jgi:hypothetical protein
VTPETAIVRRDVQLESGSVLKAGTTVRIWGREGDCLGIEWHDADGLHSMAIHSSKVTEGRP